MRKLLLMVPLFLLTTHLWAAPYVSETIKSPFTQEGVKKVTAIQCEEKRFELDLAQGWIEADKGYYFQFTIDESNEIVYGRVSNNNFMRKFDCQFELRRSDEQFKLSEQSVKCYCRFGNEFAENIIRGKYVEINQLLTGKKKGQPYFSLAQEESSVREILCGVTNPSNGPLYFYEK